MIHTYCCLLMTGIIWLVQILIYPMFIFVGKDKFEIIHQFQMKRITWLVGPLMFLEILTAILLLYQIGTVVYFINLISVLILWFLTFFVNVPAHGKLSFSDENSKKSLVLKNWPRTFIWTLRSVFLLYMII